MRQSNLLINACSQQGSRRKNNQDCLGLSGWRSSQGLIDQFSIELSNDELPALFLLADGIGGHEKGEVASLTAIDTIFHHFAPTQKDFNIIPAVMEAHTVLTLNASSSYRPMGTTIVGLVLTSDEATVFNVGDSRALKLDDTSIIQISHDDVGDQTPQNVITQSLGGGSKLPKLNPLKLNYCQGDTFVLVSDGISGWLENDDIHQIVKLNDADSSFHLCSEAVRAGSGDDVSALVIKCPS